MAILVFLVYRVYVLLANSSLGKDIRVFGAIGFVVTAVMIYGMIHFGNFSYRGYVMHLGVMFGVIMIGNVFETILPAQKKILNAIKPEAVYFTEQNGQRGAILIVDVADASKVPVLAEPWFLLFQADVEFRIVMSPDDLKHSGIDAMGKKWS